jgi:hypothetical protein
MLGRHEKWLIWLYAACSISLANGLALGHGTPIHVEVEANRLTVSQGWVDMEGYAPMIFGEEDEDGEPFATLVLPQVGSAILWQLPGLDIFGMEDQSNLSIEVLPRPAKDASPLEKRLVWYWDPDAELVSAAQAGFHLLASGMRFTTLSPIVDDGPDPFLLADPIEGEQGFHNHGLISFALDNDPSPPAGAYGYFARLISDTHEASSPFLLVFNHDMEPSLVPTAGLAINAAAFLPGDYNHDDQVDAADYIVWRNTLGSMTEWAADGSGNQVVDAADYEVWRAHFGSEFEDSVGRGVGTYATVPEPSGVLLMIACVATTLILRLHEKCKMSRLRPFSLGYDRTRKEPIQIGVRGPSKLKIANKPSRMISMI